MADENPEANADDAAPARKEFMSGWRAWAVVAGVTLVNGLVWGYILFLRDSGSGTDGSDAPAVYLEDPAILQSRVEMNNFSATIPGPGGDLRPLNFNLVLELHHLPEEKRPGAVRPTTAQIEVFRTVVVQLESKIRDHLNTFLTGQSFTNLLSDRGPDLVKAEVLRFVNNELERYDFTALKIPEEISRRRVTNVLLPSWTLM